MSGVVLNDGKGGRKRKKSLIYIELNLLTGMKDSSRPLNLFLDLLTCVPPVALRFPHFLLFVPRGLMLHASPVPPSCFPGAGLARC